MSTLRLISLIILASPSILLAEDPHKITYTDNVFAILEGKCLNCHNSDETKGGLDLASYGSTMTGGSGGAVVVSEDPKGSRLFTLASQAEEPIMPPKGTKMTEAELKVISDWIAGGLLETKSSKAKKPTKPKIDLNSLAATGKPEGPPPMPENLLLEPDLVTERPNSIPSLAHSPWAPLIAVAGQKQVLLYHSIDLDLLGVLPFPEGFPQTLRFSSNGLYLACGGGRAGKSGKVVVWDIKTGERVLEAGKEFNIVLGADVSPDLTRAVLGGPTRLIKLWDTEEGKQIASVKKHTDWLLAAAYSPDGVLYATGDRAGNLYVWEAATGYEFYTLKGHTLAVTDLDWRMDGNVLGSVSEDGQAILWELENGNQIKKWAAHPGGAEAIDFAPNGNIATAGRDKKVKLWKGDGTAIRTLDASDDLVLSVAYSDDSKRVFSGDLFGNVRVWDAETGAELGRIDPNPPTIAVQLANAEKKNTELSSQIPKTEEALKAIAAELATARASLAEREKAVADATAPRDAKKNEFNTGDAAVKALATAEEALKKDLDAKNAAAKAINDAIPAGTAALDNAKAESARLSGEIAKQQEALQKAKAELDAAKAEAAKPALSAEAKAQFDSLSAALQTATAARDAAAQALAQASAAPKEAAQAAEQDAKLATLKQDLDAKTAAAGKAEADLKPLREADAAGQKRVSDAQALAAAKTGAHEQAEKTWAATKQALEQANAKIASVTAEIAKKQAELPSAQAAAAQATSLLAAKQKELADARTRLTPIAAALKTAEDTLAALAKERDAAKEKVTALAAKETETKNTLESTRRSLAKNQFLLRKWQAASFQLAAQTHEKELAMMESRLQSVTEKEVTAKQEAEAATAARKEAEQTLEKAKSTSAAGISSLKESSSSVLERAVHLVSGRAVAELRQSVQLSSPAAASNTEKASTVSESLAYKTPEELEKEVQTLQQRMTELEQFLVASYDDANKTKSDITVAEKIAAQTPTLIAERSEKEKEAIRTLNEVSTDKKQQEATIISHKKQITELQTKYRDTVPKRDL